MDSMSQISAKRGLLALSPVALFLLLYVAVSAVIGDFYKIPLAVALVVAAAWSVAVMPQRGLTQRLEVFSKAAGHPNVIYMIWIFILAGAFASIAKETRCGHVDCQSDPVAVPCAVYSPGSVCRLVPHIPCHRYVCGYSRGSYPAGGGDCGCHRCQCAVLYGCGDGRCFFRRQSVVYIRHYYRCHTQPGVQDA